jgi:predicted small lipoprotein YifL
MIRARLVPFLAVPLAVAFAAVVGACGQKGDLKLPAAKTTPGEAQPKGTPTQPAAAPSAAPTPPPRSTK